MNVNRGVNLDNSTTVYITCQNCRGSYIYVPRDSILDAGSTYRCPFCLLDTVVDLLPPAKYMAITTLLAQKEKLEQERNELVKLYGEADLEAQTLRRRCRALEDENIALLEMANDHSEHLEWFSGTLKLFMEARKKRKERQG